MSEGTTNQSTGETWVLVTTVLASSMAFIDATALNVALPAIQSQVNATASEVFWIVNSYSVVTAALILFGGALGDEFGRRRVFGVGIAVFMLGSLGCGFSLSVWSLTANRTLQGLGAAMMIPGSLSIISSTFTESKRGRAIGIWSACSVVMTAMGPILGGLLTDAGWWRAIFFINLPIGFTSIAVLMTKVTRPERSAHVVPSTHVVGSDESDQRTGKIDVAGAAFSMLGLAGVNLAFLEVASRGWSDRVVLVGLLLGVFFLCLFVWNESRSSAPLLPLGLFRNRNFSAACQMTICFYSGVYGMLFFLALNLVQVQHYTALVAGVAQLPVMVGVVLTAPIAGRWVDRSGPRLPLILGGVLATAGFLFLARPGLELHDSSYWTTFFPPMMLLGVAMGLCATTLSTTIMNTAGHYRFGIASGINSTLSRLSSVLGIALLGPIAILTFRRSLAIRCGDLPMEERWSQQIARDSWRLADTVPPPGMSPEMMEAVTEAIGLSFVDAFRVVSLASAAAVGLSTLYTALMMGQCHANE